MVPINGKPASTNALRISATRGRVIFATSASRFVGKSLGSPQKDDSHQKINSDGRVFRGEHFAEGIGKSDRERRNHRAVDGADPADHYDHKTNNQDLIPHAGKYRRDRRGDHARERSESRTEREYQRE